MKSFTQFISENLNPTQEDYNEIIRLLISDDPLERYLGAQELELYSDEEKMRVQQGILDFFKLDSEKIKKISQSATNPYYTLIEFEKIGAVDFFNTPENIFRDLFKNQFIIKAAAENMSFEEIVNATALDLKLSELSPNLFNGLDKLERLTIYGKKDTAVESQTGDLDSSVFKGLAELESLEIYDFKINKIRDNIFKDNPKLLSVIIKKCSISEISDSAFSSDSLTTLKINDNSIKSINNIVFNDIPKLNKLDLSFSRIENLTPGMFNGLDSLSILYLSSNKIKIIPNGAFDGLANLKDLWLDNNPITKIEDNAFAGLNNLKDLSMIDVNIAKEEYEDQLSSNTSVTLDYPF